MENTHKQLKPIRGKKGQDSLFSQIPPVLIGIGLLLILLIILGVIFRKEIPTLLDGIWNALKFGGG